MERSCIEQLDNITFINIKFMKQFLLITGLFICSISYGQTGKKRNDPVYFIDSVRVAPVSMGLLSPNEISNIYVEKDDGSNDYGKIYISTKTGVKLTSLNDILKQYHIVQEKPMLFVIGKDVLLDTTNVRVDKRYVEEVYLHAFTDFGYLPKITSDMIICNIKLYSELPKPGTIRIQ